MPEPCRPASSCAVLRRPIRPTRAMAQSVSPNRMRVSSCRYSNISNLQLATPSFPCAIAPGRVPARNVGPRPQVSSPAAPPLSKHEMAPYRRSQLERGTSQRTMAREAHGGCGYDEQHHVIAQKARRTQATAGGLVAHSRRTRGPPFCHWLSGSIRCASCQSPQLLADANQGMPPQERTVDNGSPRTCPPHSSESVTGKPGAVHCCICTTLQVRGRPMKGYTRACP